MRRYYLNFTVGLFILLLGNLNAQTIWNGPLFEFVKQNCTLEDGETYEILGNDLMNQVNKAKL